MTTAGSRAPGSTVINWGCDAAAATPPRHWLSPRRRAGAHTPTPRLFSISRSPSRPLLSLSTLHAPGAGASSASGRAKRGGRANLQRSSGDGALQLAPSLARFAARR
ncbi:hypothetical protein BGZ61DRAFT_472183 [Ilyonectria robusta]|uniref:uncharacterized protein n=1 Tax=Ilyonectria robusta TaxID=1079257 RepID=UPI001E8E2B3A|nr:uncharacterized protein BGZ61DRAFT_472183 [Ilyonectria robusta]KAH8735787.1 hypothetical protein BGZ61DRAFT_472183 [Ilyonectria robusta]